MINLNQLIDKRLTLVYFYTQPHGGSSDSSTRPTGERGYQSRRRRSPLWLPLLSARYGWAREEKREQGNLVQYYIRIIM
jgi:hypothetical protein